MPARNQIGTTRVYLSLIGAILQNAIFDPQQTFCHNPCFCREQICCIVVTKTRLKKFTHSAIPLPPLMMTRPFISRSVTDKYPRYLISIHYNEICTKEKCILSFSNDWLLSSSGQPEGGRLARTDDSLSQMSIYYNRSYRKRNELKIWFPSILQPSVSCEQERQ